MISHRNSAADFKNHKVSNKDALCVNKKFYCSLIRLLKTLVNRFFYQILEKFQRCCSVSVGEMFFRLEFSLSSLEFNFISLILSGQGSHECVPC